MTKISAMRGPRILLVEDEPGLLLSLSDLLANEGYRVETASDGRGGLDLATRDGFDLIVLDVMLPGIDGFEVCRTLRRRNIHTPILILTARAELVDRVLGLKIGADDYLPKPFAPPELLARIQALLRRAAATPTAPPSETFQFGSVAVDFRSTQVRKDGLAVEMSAREFELLSYFILHKGATLSRQRLLKEVWGYDSAVMTRTVDVHVALLRQKLEGDPKNPQHFLTMRGLGYRFLDQNEDEGAETSAAKD
jgi:two-component system, OmpR family, alkaline phosphatase synthesis response regulator PhoP